MRIGIISDIHGNLEAAKASLLFLGGKTDFITMTGDVVGYGPDPEECVELVMEKAGTVLKGNHEEGIITGNLSRFKETARIALEWTQSRLSSSCKSKLEGFPEKDVREDCLFVHASVSDPIFKYLLNSEDACEEFGVLDKKICFFGHTHMPGGFRKKADGAVEVIRTDFSGRLEIGIEDGFSYLINVGSVGQPRDGFPFACAAIYDTGKNIVNLHRIEYPLEITRKKIIERGLPSVLARRIVQGI
ncbi:MAG: metallophosphoesterase family protein [Candidatus Omnitrophica bacterium]|nr:metallophosphoesterase family protein [Candidatus Omnitrophota bacterium]